MVGVPALNGGLLESGAATRMAHRTIDAEGHEWEARLR